MLLLGICLQETRPREAAEKPRVAVKIETRSRLKLLALRRGACVQMSVSLASQTGPIVVSFRGLETVLLFKKVVIRHSNDK